MNSTPPGRCVTLLRVTLEVLDRWAIGGVDRADEEIDLPVLTDPRGREPTAYVPGTTLAGSLRRALGDDATAWLGPEPSAWEEETTVRENAKGRRRDVAAPERIRSQLGFLGVHRPEMALRVRGATAVEGERQAAATHTLRVEQWVDAGEITILLEHDGPRDGPLVEALLAWRPVLGRGASSGLGRAVPLRVESVSLDLAEEAHLAWWLTTRHTWYAGTPAPSDPSTEAGPPEGTVTVRWGREPDPATGKRPRPEWGIGAEVLAVTWEVVDPVHVGHTEANSGAAGEPTVDRTLRLRGENSRVLIPGASWKGVFRHRVEFILEAVGLGGEERTVLVDWLFGSTSRPGLLTFHDALGGTGVTTQTHVAIDRFTGGALDSALFQVEAVARGTTLEWRVRTTAAAPDEETLAVVRILLGHVVRDIDDGIIGIGGGATRGYGSLAVKASTPWTVPALEVDRLTALATDVTSSGAPVDAARIES